MTPAPPLGYRVNMAWKKTWAMREAMCTRALSIRARLDKLQEEVLSVLLWGSPAWHLRPAVISAVAATVADDPPNELG